MWKKTQGFTYLIRERETGFSFYYFYNDLWKNSELCLLDLEEKKPDSVSITFIRICKKKIRLYLLDPEERNRIQFLILFIRICEKKLRALLTWSGRERPDSVFITFIMICEKIQNFTYLIRKKETRFSFYYFYSVLLIRSGSWSVWNPIRKMLDIIRKKLCFTWRPGPSSW